MRRVASPLLGALLCSVSFGCTDARKPPAATPPTVTLAGDGGTVDTASASATDDPAPSGDGGDFYSCAVDTDCVAVGKVACCPNGRLEAVNKQSVDAYRSPFTCERKHRICPQFRILDRRQPICVNETHRCEMVPPDKIACGGTGPNPHACPRGATCDATGHCAAPSP